MTISDNAQLCDAPRSGVWACRIAGVVRCVAERLIRKTLFKRKAQTEQSCTLWGNGAEPKRRDISSQRFGISDVCRSVAKANMGGGFWIKAVTRYAVLYDVCFSFSDDSRTLFYYKNKFYFCLGVGAEGLGVNAPKPRLLI